jgi:hypothetical protein
MGFRLEQRVVLVLAINMNDGDADLRKQIKGT